MTPAPAPAPVSYTHLDAGYVTVLVEMIAGASATPGLGPEVAARIRPWTEFAQRAIDGALADSPFGSVPVSYTHLDVYKRQERGRAPFPGARSPCRPRPAPRRRPARHCRR